MKETLKEPQFTEASEEMRVMIENKLPYTNDLTVKYAPNDDSNAIGLLIMADNYSFIVSDIS